MLRMFWLGSRMEGDWWEFRSISPRTWISSSSSGGLDEDAGWGRGAAEVVLVFGRFGNAEE